MNPASIRKGLKDNLTVPPMFNIAPSPRGSLTDLRNTIGHSCSSGDLKQQVQNNLIYI